MGKDGDGRKDLGRAHHLGQQRAVVDQRQGSVEHCPGEEQPRQEAAEQEQGIGIGARESRTEYVGKYHRIDGKQKQGIEQ